MQGRIAIPLLLLLSLPLLRAEAQNPGTVRPVTPSAKGQPPLPVLPAMRPPGKFVPPAIPTPFLPKPDLVRPQTGQDPRTWLLYGVNIQWNEGGGIAGWERGDRARRFVAQMKAAGMTNVRIPVLWAEREPERGRYNWAEMDRLVKLLRGQNFVLTCVVSGTPEWASGAGEESVRQGLIERGIGSSRGVAPASRAFSDLARFAAELGKRYRESVHRWEFWKEPDGKGLPTLSRDSSGKLAEVRFGDPVLYTRLLNIFSASIRKADPTCLVAVGGLTTRRTEFLQALYANGGQKAFDAVSLHPCEGANLPDFGWIDACHRVMTARGDGRKKVWLTEWGWNTYPQTPDGIAEGQQAKWIRQSLLLMRQRDFIEQASYLSLNTLRDAKNDTGRSLLNGNDQPRPAFIAFQKEAFDSLKAVVQEPRRIPLLPELPRSIAETAAHVSVETNGTLSVLPRLWRGLSPEAANADVLPANWERFAPQVNVSGASLLRLAPFDRPGVLTVTAEGTPVVKWEKPDALLAEAVKQGSSVLLSLAQPPAMTLEGWSAFVSAVVRRYGTDPKFGVLRWEFTASLAGSRRLYVPFAQAVHVTLPATPVGFRLADGSPEEALTILAEQSAKESIPLDSFGWRAETDPLEAAQTLRRLRALLGRSPLLKSTYLLPEVGGDEAAMPLATILRLLDYAPPGQRNGLLGVLASQTAYFSPNGALRPAASSLALLNRTAGQRLPLVSEGDVRGLASRSATGLSILLWREGEGAGGPVMVRLPGLKAGQPYRIQMFSAVSASVPVGGANIAPGAGEIEIPCLLPARGVLLLEVLPGKKPALEVTLTAPRYVWHGGEMLEFLLTVHNNGTAARKLPVALESTLPGFITADIAKVDMGTVPAGKTNTLRYRLRVPTLGRDAETLLSVRVGNEGVSCLGVRVATPLVASLEMPNLDTGNPGARGRVKVRLANRGTLPLPLTLRSPGSPLLRLAVPANGSLVREMEVVAPSNDPGVFPVDISIEDQSGPLTTLQAFVGVPVTCRYATVPPTIDGDLSDWAGAEPMGMGRREQVFGKVWRGPTDLSAIAYSRWDEKFFYFACAVTDDTVGKPAPATELWRGDSVQFAFSADRATAFLQRGYGPGEHEFGLTLLEDGKPLLSRFAGPPDTVVGPMGQGRIAIRRVGTHTYYEAAIPWSQLKPALPKTGALFGFAVRVNDNDGAETGYIAWCDGFGETKTPALFPPLRLMR